MYSYGPPHMAKQKQDDQFEHIYSIYVRIWDVALKTCQRRWMIGRSGERGSRISVLAARHDDDNDDDPTHNLFSAPPGSSGLESSWYKGVLHIRQSSKTGASPSDCLVWHLGHIMGPTLLQRGTLLILRPKPNVQGIFWFGLVWFLYL